MKRLGALIFILVFLFVPAVSWAQNVPGTDFPFSRFQLRLPPMENSLPGFGNYYSSLSRGIESAMWNPALISKIKYTESSLGIVSDSGLSGYNYRFTTEDKAENLGGLSYINAYLYFTGDPAVNTVATREHTSHNMYSTKGTGTNFKEGLRVTDWLTVGFISRSDLGGIIDTSGNFPVINKICANFRGSQQTIGNDLTINIDNNGYPTLTITPEGGSTYTQQLQDQVWSGFLDQNSTVPYTVMLEAKNDMSFSAPVTMVGAGQWRDLSVGLSLTPITATCNVNNNARAVINDGTPDIVFYQPNFDPNSEQSILNWSQDPNQYGTEVGYKRNTVTVPAGEVIGEARYRGFYTASTARMDLGMTYDFGENVTVGLALENMSGSTLDFKGNGISSYVNSRIGSLEAPTLDPTTEFNWQFFNDTFATVEGTEDYYLEPELTANLPRRMRLGLTLRKPWLISVDYEQNSTPIKFKYEDSVTKQVKIGEISNIALLRFGAETQVFFFPWWLRSSAVFMLPPSASNVDPEFKKNMDKAFKYGILPLGLEMATDVDLWSVITGASFGFNLSPFISLAQADSLNLDLGKVIYYDIHAGQGPWKLTYLAAFDPGSTATAYANRADKTKEGFDPNYLRFIQTLTLSYKF